MFCNKCGSEIPDDSKFCNKCGAEIIHKTSDNKPKVLENPKVDTDKPKKTKIKKTKKISLEMSVFIVIVIIGLILFISAIYVDRNRQKTATNNTTNTTTNHDSGTVDPVTVGDNKAYTTPDTTPDSSRDSNGNTVYNNKGTSSTTDSTTTNSTTPTEPEIGMTAEQVINSSWGRPDKINRTTTAYGTNEQWVYGEDRYIYLDDGIVTSIQD